MCNILTDQADCMFTDDHFISTVGVEVKPRTFVDHPAFFLLLCLLCSKTHLLFKFANHHGNIVL